ncbi:unnamed protein product [Rodentolepis nana]|uniref:Transmembrane protein 68 n=1 Tax=Rodentolepis nana TaxID=102285 RepID=A0A0R3TBK2_RODNA|nr:unnamed protein product [Rodentolepis nana]
MCFSPFLYLLAVFTFTTSILLLCLFALHEHFFPLPPPSASPLCNETCGVISDQAEAKLALPHLLFELLAILARHLPRYVAACLAWLWPIVLGFLVLPVTFVAFLYGTALLVQLYILRHWIVGESNISKDELLVRLMAAVWEAHGRAFHGYEVFGMEKLPPPGEGAFLIYYHGTLPLDAYYFMARHIILRDRHPIPVVDRFLFRLPGLQQILRLTCAMEGSIEECVSLLNPSLTEANRSHHANYSPEETSEPQSRKGVNPSRSGQVLLLSPGGVREAIFSDEYYSLLWGKRRGFARIAIKAKKPIYPVFTENIREGVRVVQYGKRKFRLFIGLLKLERTLCAHPASSVVEGSCYIGLARNLCLTWYPEES